MAGFALAHESKSCWDAASLCVACSILNDCSHYRNGHSSSRGRGNGLLEHAKSGFPESTYKAAINLVTDADRQAEEQIIVNSFGLPPTDLAERQ